jgi:conjugative transfer pilus assembly protein TraH
MFKLNFPALALGVCVSLGSTLATANIQSQMDSMFEGMTNTTAPGAFETATRGVVSGGSMSYRNKIVNAPVVSFRPPSMQAGCGGIDMFAGSFSFINAQQFVQSLRSIASNAVGVASGYAFKLALNAMGPTVHNVIKDLQEAMQFMNGLMSNSCQLATGLVTDTFMAFGASQDVVDKNKSFTKGLKDNFGSYFGGNTDGKNAAEANDEAGFTELCKDKGNVVWCEMTKKNLRSFFSYGSRQTDELIMSMTGSYIIGGLDNAADGKGKSKLNRPVAPMPGIDLVTLIEGKKGEKISIYDCSFDTVSCTPEDDADPIPTQEIEFDGIAAKIVKAFRGHAGSPGIIHKWATNTGTFNNDEAAIIAGLQETSFSAMIQRLSQRSANMAGSFVESHSKLMAREATYSLAKAYLDSVRLAITGSEMASALGEKPRDFLDPAYNNLQTQYAAAIAKFGNDKQMVEDYAQKMQVLPAPQFINALGVKTNPSVGD